MNRLRRNGQIIRTSVTRFPLSVIILKGIALQVTAIINAGVPGQEVRPLIGAYIWRIADNG